MRQLTTGDQNDPEINNYLLNILNLLHSDSMVDM